MFDVRNRTKNSNLRNTLEKVACQLQSTANNDDDPTATNTVVHHFAPVQRQRLQHQQQQPQQYREHSFGGHQHQHQQHPYLEDMSGENDLTHPQNMHKQHHQHHHKATAQHGFDMVGGGSIAGGGSELAAAGSSGSIHHQHHHLVNLMQLGAERLPCPGELAGPTELPLSRESIAGLDLRWLSGGMRSSASKLTMTAVPATTTMILLTATMLALVTTLLGGNGGPYLV